MYICNMRKYFVFAAAALVVLAACQKKNAEPVAPIKDPAWLNDESLPVPIEIGGQDIAETKGSPISSTDFSNSNFRYSVIAFNKENDAVMKGFEGGVLAHNANGALDADTGDDLTNQNVVEFLDNSGVKKDMYYPYLYKEKYTTGNVTSYITGAYNFYGFRIDGSAPTITGTSINGIEMGTNDIIWAEAVASGTDETAANLGNTSVGRNYEDSKGFSARYIRGIRREYVTNNHSMADYIDALPHLKFKHITSQIQFYINAFDQIAEYTLRNAHVAISDITIGGTTYTPPTSSSPIPSPLAETANLNIKTGTFTYAESDYGTIHVTNIASNFSITQAGAQCGDPLFIAPFTGNILLTISLTLPNMTESEEIQTVLVAPAIAQVGDPGDANYREPVAQGTFAPNYIYKFTISLESIEKINIIASLEDWGSVIEPAAPTVID